MNVSPYFDAAEPLMGGGGGEECGSDT